MQTPTEYNQFLETEEATLSFGARLSQIIQSGCVIFLHGELGSGKTTFTRGFLRGLGYQEKVKSPTYTLVEPYIINEKTIFHFDLYRLISAAELEYIGINEYFTQQSICLIEWPEKGFPFLPSPDLVCHFSQKEKGREIKIEAKSKKCEEIIKKLIS